MKTTKITMVMLALVAGVFASCKKKESPAHEPRVTVKSFIFNTYPSAWIQENGSKAYSAFINLENVDENVLASGSVNVFLGDGTGSTWAGLPSTRDNLQYGFSIASHTVKITVSEITSSNTPMINPGIQQFRVVIISESARTAHPEVNFNDYNEIKRVFLIQE